MKKKIAEEIQCELDCGENIYPVNSPVDVIAA
jgi:hypothetical protein